jgi:hypothetical protein
MHVNLKSYVLSVFGPGRALSRRVNLSCVLPNPDGDAKRIHGGLSWFGQRRPYVQRRGEYCISLHRIVCVGVTSCERGSQSQVSRKRGKWEMLISEVEKIFVPLPGEPSAFSFIESSGGRGVLKTLRRCLGGEGAVGAVEVVVATCICECRPTLGCRGDVGDRTVKDPGSCGERAIPCGRRADVDPLLSGGARGLVGTWLRGSTRNG